MPAHPNTRGSSPPIAERADVSGLAVSAGEILQAHSALFLLVHSASAPNLDELEATTARVRDWLGDLSDRLAQARRDLTPLDSARYVRLYSALVESQRMLERFVPYRARTGEQVPAAVAMHAITVAHRQLVAVRTGPADILASCCAAYVTRIARWRNP